jgi:glutaminyl-tRNA synthetase
LRHAFVIRCTGYEADAQGRVTTVMAEVMPDSRSGTPGADTYKVKGNLHWISAAHALPAEVRLYERLFTEPQPDAGGRDYLASLNADSKRVIQAWVEPTVLAIEPGAAFQFERHGYFVPDRRDSQPDRLVFNRSVSLKDTRAKGG